MKEVYTLYKLIILYVIDRIQFPLTNGQLCAFFAEEQFTDYFTLQETLGNMVENELLETEIIRNTTHYSLTEAGKEILSYFEEQIPTRIQKDIDAYLKKNKYALREENAVIADYCNTEDEEYLVTLLVKERNNELIRLQLRVPVEQQAIMVCDKWQKKNSEVYQFLVKELMS